MFLKCSIRHKDGKTHRSWSIVESRRVQGGGVVQRHLLYLGEISDSQQAAWQRSIAVFSEDESEPRQMVFFPEDCAGASTGMPQIQLRLHELSLHRPRQWGACWLALEFWRELRLDQFWAQKLAPSRKGTRWDLVLTTLAIYRWLDPGSEWRLHRQWFEQSALGDLLGRDCRLVADDTLYRCHDLLVAHKEALFTHLQERWRDLFNAKFEVLLYDLTSTYFECDPPEQEGLRRFGYSRDKRSDCVRVVIALIVNLEGLPIGYEVLSGNTSDKTTLKGMLEKIEAQYGKAERTWIMDRGIPTEETLEQMRASTPPVRYLVGTPKGRLSKLEKDLAELPWHEARPGVEVKLLPREGELYVFAQSQARIAKERAMRRRKLKKLWARLRALHEREIHQKDHRIEAHIFVAFLAYCLHVTLGRRLHALAPGLSARSALEKFAAISMLDVHLPTTDGRTLQLTRFTQPDQETQLLLKKLKLELPPQPPPKITAGGIASVGP